MAKTVYTITDVAKVLLISDRTVYEYIYRGELKAAKIANQRRIKPEWVDQFIERKAEGESWTQKNK